MGRRFAVMCAGVLVACKSDPPPPTDGPRVVTTRPAPSEAGPAVASAAPSVVASAAPRKVPEEQVVGAAAKDGVRLQASWYAASPEAPVVVLVHKLGGQRGDWQPLVRAVLARGPEVSLLLPDVRGHGAAASAPGGRTGAALQKADVEAAEGDVQALLAEVERRQGKEARTLLGVGADLGATVLTRLASRDARWSALVLASPVAALRGVDLYRPFAEVRRRPTLLIGSTQDTVSSEPMTAMAAMVGGRVDRREIPGAAHDLAYMAQSSPALWTDLADWIARTLSAPPPAASAGSPPAGAVPVASASAAPAASSAATPPRPPAPRPNGKKP